MGTSTINDHRHSHGLNKIQKSGLVMRMRDMQVSKALPPCYLFSGGGAAHKGACLSPTQNAARLTCSARRPDSCCGTEAS
jgi:hypothetical protein